MFPFAISMPGPFELILLTGLGLLFFGKRLPDVGRSIGQTIVQFKKGLSDVQNDIEKSGGDDSSSSDKAEKK